MSTVHYLDGRDSMLAALDRYARLVREGKIEYLVVIAENEGEVEFAWNGRGHSVPARRVIGTLEIMKAKLIADHEQVAEVEPCG